MTSLLALLPYAFVVLQYLHHLLALLPHSHAPVHGTLVVIEPIEVAKKVGVIPRVVDASLGPVLQKVLEEGESLEDDAPRGRTGGLDRLPHEFGHEQDCMKRKKRYGGK